MMTQLKQNMMKICFTDSGGATEIIVASGNDDKVVSVREAFQNVFGRATVYGHASQAKTIAAQPVGFESAELAAKERINALRSNETFIDSVIVSVENFVVELYKNQLSGILQNSEMLIDKFKILFRWFDVGLLMLSDPIRNITLKSFTQMTFIPLQIITSLESDTPKDYEKRGTGFAMTVGAAMSRNLDVRQSKDLLIKLINFLFLDTTLRMAQNLHHNRSHRYDRQRCKSPRLNLQTGTAIKSTC